MPKFNGKSLSCPSGKRKVHTEKMGTHCRKPRKDRGQKRTRDDTWQIVGEHKGKKVYKSSMGRGGLFTVSSSSGKKSYLGKNHKFRRGEAVY